MDFLVRNKQTTDVLLAYDHSIVTWVRVMLHKTTKKKKLEFKPRSLVKVYKFGLHEPVKNEN